MKKIAIAACLAATMAAPAFAADKGTTYVGAGWMLGNIDAPTSANPTNGRLKAGMYFIDNVAAEVHLLALGQASNGVTIDQGYGIFGRGDFPVSDKVSIFGHVGYGNVDASSFASAKSGFAYGVGVEFGLGEKLALELDYTIYQNDSASTYNATTVGVKYYMK